MALIGELLTEFLEIIDCPVMHDSDFTGAIAMRVGVFHGGFAVSGPARVADAGLAVMRGEFFSQGGYPYRIFEHLDAVIIDGDAAGIVAAVFKFGEGVQKNRLRFFISDIAYNSTHFMFYLTIVYFL